MRARLFETCSISLLALLLALGTGCGDASEGTATENSSTIDAGGTTGSNTSDESASNSSNPDEKRDGERPEDGSGEENTAQSEGDWSCLGETKWAETDRSELSFESRAVSALGGDPLQGVNFEVCADSSTATCEEVVFSGQTEDEGLVRGRLPLGETSRGFDGYARVAGDDRLLETIVFFHPPITENRDAPESIPLVTREQFETLVETSASLTPNPDRGHLALEALDCSWSRSAGVEFSIDTADAETTKVYLRDGMKPSTQASRTDASGLAGYLNVPPGPVTVTARVAATGDRLGSVEVFVEAGAISEVPVAPSPE